MKHKRGEYGRALTIEQAADMMLTQVHDEWLFVTHEGQLVGPNEDREELKATCMLYLAAAIKED